MRVRQEGRQASAVVAALEVALRSSVSPPPGSSGRVPAGRAPWETVVVWSVYAVFVVMRFPAMRRGAAPYYEEGATYLRFALSHGWWDSLWQPHLGYLALWSNLTGVVEAAVPWAWVPAISVVFGLVGPTAVVAVVARASGPLWCRLVAVAVVVWTSTMTREWYSPIHAQFWLTCAIVLSVGAPPTRRWHRVGDVVLAVVAGAAGAVSLAAVPVLTVAAVVDREYRRHLAMMAAVLTVVGGASAAVGSGREVTMPAGRLAYFVVVKAVWQPLTGEWGAGPARDWYAWHGWLASAGWLVAGVVVIGVVWWATSGRWRVVALGGLWVTAVMLWFSLPPDDVLVSPRLGGRYVVAGAVALFCGLVFGAHGRARAVGVVAVSAAVLQGVMVDADNDRAGAHVSAFRDDIAAAENDPGVSVRIEPGTCRVPTDPTRQRAGFEVIAGTTASTVELVPADVVAGDPIEVFAIVVISGTEFAAVDTSGDVSPLDGYFFGGMPDNYSQPGWCFFGQPPPVAGTSPSGGPVMIDLAAAGAGKAVFVGAGRSFADALAAGTFARITGDGTIIGSGGQVP